MHVVGTILVCTVEVMPGVHVGATWDGGPSIGIHITRPGGPARIASWPIWNEAWDSPLIEPTRESFERFVSARLAEVGVVDGLVELASV